MKALGQITALVFVGAACGLGGYFLGIKQSRPLSSVTELRQAQKENSARVSDRKSAGRSEELPALDSREIRARLDAEKNPLARFKFALDHLEDWVDRNPQDALNWLMSQPPTDRRDEIFQEALAQFSENDPQGAAEWVQQNFTGNELNNAIILIAGAWARENGQEAANWFLTKPNSNERKAALETIFFNWASDEPSAALDFLKKNPNIGDLTEMTRKAALAGWAKTEPEAAVTESLALSRANSTPEQFANTLANWATVDLDSSSQWLLKNVSPGKERSAAAKGLAMMFSDQSPEAGTTFFSKLQPGEEQEAFANTLIAEWSRKDPANAGKWAAAQTIQLSPEAINRLGRSFIFKDENAFTSWRDSLPAGPFKDQLNHLTRLNRANGSE